VALALTQSTTIKSHAFDVEYTTLSSAEAFKVAAMEQGPELAGLKQIQTDRHSAFNDDDKFHDGVPSADKRKSAALQDAEEAMHLGEFEYEESGPGAIKPAEKNSQPSAFSCKIDVTSSNKPTDTWMHK
jgi:hypothetical protein